jgi:membrane-associated phospholipid phosphatase
LLSFTLLKHLSLGTIDWSLVIPVWVGSVPGGVGGAAVPSCPVEDFTVYDLCDLNGSPLETRLFRLNQSWLTAVFGIAVPLLSFILLAIAVSLATGGIAWDEPILLAIHSTVQPRLDSPATVLTELGVYWGVFPAALVVAMMLLATQQWQALTYLLMTTSGSILLNRIFKLGLHRSRPHLWETDYSVTAGFAFPSGHAMSSITLMLILVILSWQTRWRWWILMIGSGVVLGVSWSRLYLGVHYPSDIVAGWMLAIAWAFITRWLVGKLYAIKSASADSSGVEKT